MEHKEIVEAVKGMTEARVIEALGVVDQLSSDFYSFDQDQSNDAAEGIAENFLKLQQLFQNPRDNRTGQDYYYQQTDGTEYVAGFWFVTKEFFDNEGYLSDQYDEELDNILSFEFHPLQEACYGYNGDHAKAKKWLDANGFTENTRLMG